MSLENTRVFIGNIYYLAAASDLKQFFSAAGTIKKLDLFVDEQGKSRGCGIIHYSTRSEATKAVGMFHHTELCNRTITVKEDETFYLQQHKPVQISIKQMPVTVTWQQLKDVCREIGNVIRADVQVQPDGTSSGTVLYENSQEALRAVQLLNGAYFNGMKVEAFIDIIN
jgi:RNA recognition motif-containing protein